jgi:WD40 repeat protein
MDVITSLSHDELRVLESFVRTCGDEGVTERQFVEAVSRIMTRQGKEAEDREGLILRLSEVFSHVDVNRNGKIKWDDFTSHCVDIGISLRVKDSSKMKYVQNTNLIDRSNHGGRVNRMRYYDGRFDCVVTCESGEKSVKVYRLHNNSKLSLLGAFEVLTEEARKSKQRPRTIDAVMIPETSLLVTSTSDMMLCFWDISQVFRTSDDDNVMPRARFLASRRCHRVQYHLAYNTETSTLYSSGPSGDVHVWGLQYNPTKPFALTQKMKLERHDGMVTDILVVPEHDVVVTCGLDKNVFVWDSRDHHFKGSRKGHKMGVRTLCYAGGGCILSAGFDFNIFAWDISGVSQAPLFVLGGGFEGHRSSVINVMADLKSQCAFSVDEEGTIRWWDVRLDFSIVDSERALQVITADASFRQNMPFKPVSSCLIPGLSKVTYPILLYGDNTISMFNPVILDPAPEIPTCMSFSSKQMMLALVLGHDVKLFSLVDGSLSHDFKDVGRKANQIRFDANETKFVLSYENGEMRAYVSSLLIKNQIFSQTYHQL